MDLRTGGARVALVLTAWALCGAAAARPVDGLYSTVCLYPETDDQGGMEVQVETGKARPVVRFAICEGGCSSEPVSDAVIAGDRLSFKTREVLLNQDGKVAESHVYMYRGVFRGARLYLRSDRPGWSHIQLPRRSRPDRTIGRAGRDPITWPSPWRRCR